MHDSNGRNIYYLSISIIDRCNIRGLNCKSSSGANNLVNNEILNFKEILQVVKASSKIGVRKIKITGGEPLARKEVSNLVGMIKCATGIEQVTMDSNGVLLSDMAGELVVAGLNSINISIDVSDTLSSNNFERAERFDKVIAGIKAAIEVGLKTKVNCCSIGNLNGEELKKVLEIVEENTIDVRFFENMPIGSEKCNLSTNCELIFEWTVRKYFGLQPTKTRHGNGFVIYYSIPGFKGNFYFINTISRKFCRSSNHISLTTDGYI